MEIPMKILFITETASIHGARWVNQFSSCGWDLHIAQGIYPFARVNSEYRAGTFHCPFPLDLNAALNPNCLVKMNQTVSFAISHISYGNDRIATALQKRLIQKLKPDVIHTLGLNINWKNNCLTTYNVKKSLGKRFPAPWIYSTWGSDLDFYARQSHKEARDVSLILPAVDYLITECTRDERLAYSYGFKGVCLAHLPAFGGVPLDAYSHLRTPGLCSGRKNIFLKGRDNCTNGDPVGRAMTAMQAFELCEKDLAGYTIIINQASPSIHAKAEELSRTTSLKIQIIPLLSYHEVLKILGSSRLFIALTVNDGIPSTLVEAMALGTFPIHSDLEPIREWISHEKNGMLVPPDDPEKCADFLRYALTDDNLVDTADQINMALIKDRMSDEVIKRRSMQVYEQIVGEWAERY